PGGDHALALRGCEAGLDQFDHHVDREPVRTQDRLGVTVTAPGKQFEGAAAVRIGTAIVVSGQHRCTATIIAPAAPGVGARRRGMPPAPSRRAQMTYPINNRPLAWFRVSLIHCLDGLERLVTVLQ